MTLRSIGIRIKADARKWFLTYFCLATAVAGHAAMNEKDALTASKVFAEAPLEVLDMLRPSTRLDMLDYYTQADSILTATNALGGESRLMEVAPDYMKVAVTPISTLEIKILKGGKSPVVMTLYTVGEEGAAWDTDVRFFDADLKPLDASKYLKAPKLTDFFTLKGSEVSEDDLEEKVPFAATVYATGPGDAPLTATLTTLRILSQEERELLTPLLRPSLSATWKSKFNFK